MNFNTCNQHHNQDTEQFYHPQVSLDCVPHSHSLDPPLALGNHESPLQHYSCLLDNAIYMESHRM